MASVPQKPRRPKRTHAPRVDRSRSSVPEATAEVQHAQAQAPQAQSRQSQTPEVQARTVEAPPTTERPSSSHGFVQKRMIGAGDTVYLTGVVTAALISGIILLLWLVGK